MEWQVKTKQKGKPKTTRNINHFERIGQHSSTFTYADDEWCVKNLARGRLQRKAPYKAEMDIDDYGQREYRTLSNSSHSIMKIFEECSHADTKDVNHWRNIRINRKCWETTQFEFRIKTYSIEISKLNCQLFVNNLYYFNVDNKLETFQIYFLPFNWSFIRISV